VRDDGTRLITPLPPFRGGAIRVEAGARHLIKYDSDDQLVTALLLESPNGEVRSLPIEWERAEYDVVTLADLPLADPRAVRAARRVARIWVLLPLCIGALLSPLVASYWWWRGRNHDGNASRSKECRAAEQGDEADER
jgi:hypothetical protein